MENGFTDATASALNIKSQMLVVGMRAEHPEDGHSPPFLPWGRLEREMGGFTIGLHQAALAKQCAAEMAHHDHRGISEACRDEPPQDRSACGA